MSTKLTPGIIITADLGDADVTATNKKILFCEANGSRRVLKSSGISGTAAITAARLLEVYNYKVNLSSL